MNELLFSFGVAVIGLIGWWVQTDPRRRKERLIKRRKALYDQHQEIQDELEFAMYNNDADAIVLLNNRLRKFEKAIAFLPRE